MSGDSENRDWMSYDDLVSASNQFFRRNKGCKVQTTANMIANLRPYAATIERFANQAYPVIHECCVQLLADFLEHKREHGSSVERACYEGMAVAGLLDRLVRKRPLAFLTAVDSWLTKDGEHGAGGWGEVGTEQQGAAHPALTLDTFLSYDEVKLSALLQLSAPSVTINSGGRDNVGRAAAPGTFLDTAVYVGAVGARFEVAGRMEYQDMLVTRRQNTAEAGYGDRNDTDTLLKIFAKFYGKNNFSTYDEATKCPELFKATDFSGSKLLDVEVYTKRIQVTAETFLLEAEHRGSVEDRAVYCHVVGLGLGVWQTCAEQGEYFLRAWVRALQQLTLPHVKTINFSWIAKSKNPHLFDDVTKRGVDVVFSRRDPFDLEVGSAKDELVVAMFAWDGNSYVGNEYWQGLLSASGDPAAASCSTIPELLNPDINTANVCGSNTRVASRSRGLVPLQQYLEQYHATDNTKL